MLKVLSFWDRERAKLSCTKITVLTFLVNQKYNKAFRGVYFLRRYTRKKTFSGFSQISFLSSNLKLSVGKLRNKDSDGYENVT